MAWYQCGDVDVGREYADVALFDASAGTFSARLFNYRPLPEWLEFDAAMTVSMELSWAPPGSTVFSTFRGVTPSCVTTSRRSIGPSERIRPETFTRAAVAPPKRSVAPGQCPSARTSSIGPVVTKLRPASRPRTHSCKLKGPSRWT